MRIPQDAVAEVRRFLKDVDPERVPAPRAAELLDGFIELERLAGAAKVLFASRAAQANEWKAQGHKNAAYWLAERQKTGVGEAIDALETSKKLEELPQTRSALKTGKLSLTQAKEIASVAHQQPKAESQLLDAAANASMKELRSRTREVAARASSEAQELARYKKIRSGRYLRWWTDLEGAFRLEARLTPDDGGRVASVIERESSVVFDEMREEGVREPGARYRADALVRLIAGSRLPHQAKSGSSGPRRSSQNAGTVAIRIDAAALRRGHCNGNEVCEIAGVGRVPVATVRRLLPESFVKILVTEGVDVQSVCHVGRSVPAQVQSALEERDRSCVVPGCDVSIGLEMHHWKLDYAKCRTTSLDGLCRMCKRHHDLVTYDGFELVGGPGKWKLLSPKEPQRVDSG